MAVLSISVASFGRNSAGVGSVQVRVGPDPSELILSVGSGVATTGIVPVPAPDPVPS